MKSKITAGKNDDVDPKEEVMRFKELPELLKKQECARQENVWRRVKSLFSDEAYEMVLRAVEADGYIPYLVDWTLTPDGWIEANVKRTPYDLRPNWTKKQKALWEKLKPQVLARVRFKETDGMLSYEIDSARGRRAFTSAVLTWDQLLPHEARIA